MLEISGVSFAYDGNVALREISLEVEKGNFVGVVGPNGSGKSTLLKIIDGVLAPMQGEVALNGKQIGRYSHRELASQIAFVPQSFELDFNFTVREVVEMGRYARKRHAGHRQSVDDLLERLEIKPLAERYFPQLSGGEKQMVVLAQALAQEPGLLLLDEPAAHLDVSYQLMLFDMLKKLSDDGLTIVCVLHDLNLALLYFEEFFMLSKGKLAAAGGADDVLNPEMIESIYGVRAYRHRHAGRTFLTFSPRSIGMRKERIHLICGGGSGSYLMRKLVDSGYSVSAGVLNTLDGDEVTGRELGIPMAAEAPFAKITDEAFGENIELVQRADLVILTDVPVGSGNIRNIEAAREAASMGKQVFAVGGIPERDFTEKAAQALAGLAGVEYFRDDGEILKEITKRWEG
jgi:iron complex transport system ATP-binding protein